MILFTVLLGIVVGFVRGGRLRVPDLGLRAMWVAPVALAMQLAAFAVPGGVAGAVLVIGSYGLLLYGLVRNAHLQSLRVVLLGVILNALVIAANGGRMPVHVEAGRAAGADVTAVIAGAAPKHVAAGPGSRFAFLGDVIPVPFLARVISVGDVAVLLGIFLLVQDLMGKKLEIHLGPGG